MRWFRHSTLFLLFAAWLAGAFAANPDKFFEPNLGDFPDELRAVRQAGKKGVLVMFEMEGCPYCRQMREQVLSRDEVQAYFHRNFATFAVDTLGNQPVTDFWGAQTTESGFARALKIQGTPTLVIFGPDGQEVVRLAGAAKDADEFMQFGRYVAEGHYKTQTPQQFYAAAKSWKKP